MTALFEPVMGAIHVAAVDERVSCDHADRCGGCPLIGLPYKEQLDLKRERVTQATAAYPALAPLPTEPVAPAHPRVGYRTRAKLIVGTGGRLGLFAKGGAHDVVDIPRCRVLSPTLARVGSAVRSLVSAAEQSGGTLAPWEGSAHGWLRGVDLREILDGEVSRALVTFVVQRARVSSLAPLQEAARELMKRAPEVAGVACNFHEGTSPQALGSQTVPLAGITSAPDRIGASTHYATFGSFVQAHRGQAGRVHAALVEAIELGGVNRGTQRVLDLYGGSGAIALGLAAAGARVRLVESFAPAVAQARAAATAQRLDVEVECADVPRALRGLAERGERFDAAVVNPPRRGMNPVAREWLARLRPRLIVYVSCDAQTFARDLDHLARLGYAAGSVSPVDMIPLTEEIESLAVLRCGAIALPPVMYAHSEILVVDKAPHEPTAANGEYASSLLERVQRLPGARQAVPVHTLEAGTSGLVVFARSPEHAAKWKGVLSSPATRRTYVAAVRGVTPTKGAVSRDLREHGKVLEARTRYRRLAVAMGHSILRVTPEQSRTHQVRRHLAAIGHPVLGDHRYGHQMTNRFFEEKYGLDRTFLHCVRLEFDEPGSSIRRVVEAPLPGDLRAVLDRTSGAATFDRLEQRSALGLGRPSSLSAPGRGPVASQP